MSGLVWISSACVLGPVWTASLLAVGPQLTGVTAATLGAAALVWGAVSYARQRRTDDDCGYATTVFGPDHELIATVTELFPGRTVWPNDAGALE
jgi:hypothetical protein